jgi:hypothetical protein
MTKAGVWSRTRLSLLLARSSTLRRTRSLLSGAKRSSGATLPRSSAPLMHPGPPPEPSPSGSPWARKRVFPGISGMEPAGIEPATSCLQIRTTGSSAVATDDQTGESADDDPHLASPFAFLCDKCLPLACLLGWWATREADPGASAPDPCRSRHRYGLSGHRGFESPLLRLETADSLLRPRSVFDRSGHQSRWVNGGQRSPCFAECRSLQTDAPPSALSPLRRKVSLGGQPRRRREHKHLSTTRAENGGVSGPCAPRWSVLRHHGWLARGPPRRDDLENEKDRVPARSLTT